jgi:hypothetical protein
LFAVVIVALVSSIVSQKLDFFGGGLAHSSPSDSDDNGSNARSGANRCSLESLDVLFSDQHFTANGSNKVRLRTSFGGAVSVICAICITVLASLLIYQSAAVPTFSQAVVTSLPERLPRGTFRLTATVWGGGLDAACGNTNGTGATTVNFASTASLSALAPFGIFHTPSDWLGAISLSMTPNATDASCTLVWECTDNCFAVSSDLIELRLRSSVPSWASFVKYRFETPGLTSQAYPIEDPSQLFSIAGSIYPSTSDGASALRGVTVSSSASSLASSNASASANATRADRSSRVSFSCTSFMVTGPRDSATQPQVAYLPTLFNVQRGSETSASAFDFNSEAGFEVVFGMCFEGDMS